METNLFSDDVVIIIGAGASVPFGLPTGLDLIDLVQMRLIMEAKSLSDLKKIGVEDINDLYEAKMQRAPIYCAYNEIFSFDDNKNIENGKNINFNFGEAINFLRENASWLNSQVSDSIDDLIRYNRDKARLLKICIVFELLNRTHSLEDMTYISKDFKLRNINQVNKFGTTKKDEKGGNITLRNWIHNFINVVRNNFIGNWKLVANWEKFKENNKIKIITFNYDGILEEILSKNWASIESKLPNWKNIFEIIHPHGSIVFRDKIELLELPRYLSINAEKIAVIHDTHVREEIRNSRSRTKEIIFNSNEIFSIGFAFAAMNCKLLGLDNWQANNKVNTIHYINFDGNKGLKIRVSNLERDFNEFDVDFGVAADAWEPDKNQFLQITDALMGGFLGEMPS